VVHEALVGGPERGAVRHQFGHVNDLLPTVLDFVGGAAALEAASRGPVPLAGHSLLGCMRSASAATPRREQFFETNGQRALWADGWKAVAEHAPGRAFEQDPWALYRLEEDFNELVDRSAEFPEQLAALRRRWTEVAERLGVLPMDDRNAERLAANAASGRLRFVFLPGMARIDRLSAPDIYDRSFRMAARIQLNTGRASGVLIAAGTALAGYEWLLLDGWQVFAYVLSRTERFVARAAETLPAGEHAIGVSFERVAPASGRATLRVANRGVGSVEIPRQWPIYAVHAGLRCGSNPGAPVSGLYKGPLHFEGQLASVVVELL
jgi:arylsulfatase